MKQIKIGVIFILSSIICQGQINFTHKKIDSIVLQINSIKLVSISIDSTYTDHAENEEYSFDQQKNLVKVKTQIGNYLGRVNGHLNRITVYYFNMEKLIFVESLTNDFSKTISSTDYYITDSKKVKLTRRERKHYSYIISQASLYQSKAKDLKLN